MANPTIRNVRSLKKKIRRLRSGIDGSNGAVGTNGTDGIQGIQGIQGVAGTNGTNGVNTTSNVFVGNITLTETAVIAIAAGVRKLTVTLAGTVTTGNYLAIPISTTPAGYAIHEAVCATNGQITVSLTAPLLAILASYSIPCKVVRIMT